MIGGENHHTRDGDWDTASRKAEVNCTKPETLLVELNGIGGMGINTRAYVRAYALRVAVRCSKQGRSSSGWV